MGISKEDKTLKKPVIVIPRWIKTLFFLMTMIISLLLFSAPIVVVIADVLLPCAFFSATLSPPSLTLQIFSSHLHNYDFRYSLIDIPLLSVVRSAIIFCVYSLCDGPRLSRGPYLAVATVCSAASLVFVLLKGSYIFIISSSSKNYSGGGYGKAMEVGQFVSSVGLAIGHVVVAYRISCREKRKLLVYKIDIEAGLIGYRQFTSLRYHVNSENWSAHARMGFLDIIKRIFQDSRINNFDRFQSSPDRVRFQVHPKKYNYRHG